jgi:hypothetical protein
MRPLFWRSKTDSELNPAVVREVSWVRLPCHILCGCEEKSTALGQLLCLSFVSLCGWLLAVRIDSVTLDHPIERAAIDPENLGNARTIPTGDLEHVK